MPVYLKFSIIKRSKKFSFVKKFYDLKIGFIFFLMPVISPATIFSFLRNEESKKIFDIIILSPSIETKKECKIK